ncbi:hypothetical protein Dsin_003777 [Dipteronia sinensis]|uniref:Uncharacterized protein n=1 Tax=Dipteronia sinensis TaxID=43782 RepID=A0AAE0B876_9ROSI|nr:hypothetical protein Dsin_003777 [Dipteronia sinensis]
MGNDINKYVKRNGLTSNPGKDKDGEIFDTRTCKSSHVKPVKNVVTIKNVVVIKESGSKFDVLNEDVGRMIVEEENTYENNDLTNNSQRNKTVLIYITNHKIKHENKWSQVQPIIKNLGFDNSFVVDANGFFGGIRILWNECRVNIQCYCFGEGSESFLDFSRLCMLTRVPLLKGFFGTILMLLEEVLICLGSLLVTLMKLPIILKERGGRTTFSNSGFANRIDHNNLVDLGFIGSKFTWMTKRGIGEAIWEWLDRAFCFMDWRLQYAEGFVRHLPRVVSDHCPVLIQLHSNHIPNASCKSFRFEAVWLKHRKFEDVISKNWES